ncbi:DUF2309 domain-containing protein [Christiangramia fulva]|uniref:Probable inorganic carbon transporter subunit DabA n=1 Tax=Christiangramia fulva TaxID=2126553 RepID=A0A2R3Z4G3_9FLAO|nr:DUF2309 domain-containing protein [Christiangramia fulva]AVR45124.1 DUF2309 domain-containing protein [Christiangramia fulva]
MEDQVLSIKENITAANLKKKMKEACNKIAPVWPLENFVAVNPYLGFADKDFHSTAQRLAKLGGIQSTLPVSFYRNKLEEGKINRSDINAALEKILPGEDLDNFMNSLYKQEMVPAGPPIATLTDVASQVTQKDWNRFFTNRISGWAASYFDNGQATWSTANQKEGIFNVWKAEAEVDFTPEISGLKNFRRLISKLPGEPVEAALKSLSILEIPVEGLSFYLHRLLLKMGGWAAYTARLDWESEMNGEKGVKLLEFLSVLICWEACIFESLKNTELQKNWKLARYRLLDLSSDSEKTRKISEMLVLQEAFELAAQREIVDKFKKARKDQANRTPDVKAQAIFCIDVRSEVFRRNLEMADQGIETLGFAGFFGFPVNYVPLAHEKGEAQCPVLIQPGPTVLENYSDDADTAHTYKDRIFKNQVQQLWKSFRSGAVTCFSFVSPLGLSYLPKLFTDSFGITRPVASPDKAGIKRKYLNGKGISLEVAQHGDTTIGIPLEQRVGLAKNALKAMSLTQDFANFVLIVGHGSTTVNNPHASGYDCGACGGRTGEPNARVAASVLNDKQVRKLLKEEGIHIPASTFFLACLHDTTTDEVTIFNEAEVPEDQKENLAELKNSLKKAGKASRTERAVRFSIDDNIETAIFKRSKDWSQVRPEWGLAGCKAFVVASRERTKDINLEGQSFLHSYNWKADKDFSVLESIMTAPMIVTSWINLQYYASTVDNEHFGAGNKTLHNLTAGVGVLEGYGGDLRVGLPHQSVFDGEKYQHEPVRLKVVIEAPLEEINKVLEKHADVRNLCDNEWIHLLLMDENGEISRKYQGDLTWENV